MSFLILDGKSNSPMPVPDDSVELGCEVHTGRTKSRAQPYFLFFPKHSLTPPAWSFDFSGYEIEEEHLSSGGKSASFAEGLFKAIVFTRSVSWIKLNTTVPDTEHWREWLRQAELAANQCRTSDDIVEEVPVPRTLRRHGYVTRCEFSGCRDYADYIRSMSSIYP